MVEILAWHLSYLYWNMGHESQSYLCDADYWTITVKQASLQWNNCKKPAPTIIFLKNCFSKCTFQGMCHLPEKTFVLQLKLFPVPGEVFF